GDPTQTDTRIMGVTREAPAAVTGRLMEQLRAQGQEKGEDAFNKRLPVIKQAEVGGFVVKIDSDGPVFAGLGGGITHGHPSVFRSRKTTRHHEGNALQSQDHCAGIRGLPLKTMESGKTRTQRTDEGLPIHSFQTLLDDLATVTQNRIRFGTSQTETTML